MWEVLCGPVVCCAVSSPLCLAVQVSVKELLGEETMEERIQQQLTIEREVSSFKTSHVVLVYTFHPFSPLKGSLKVQSVTHLFPDSSENSTSSAEVTIHTRTRTHTHKHTHTHTHTHISCVEVVSYACCLPPSGWL